MARKCFISFKTEDVAFKKAVQMALAADIIDKSLDEAIDSDDEDYILSAIRSDYLSDSIVTIHLIGAASSEHLGRYEQRYIKRELQASLYNGSGNTRSGILGLVLPHVHDAVYRGLQRCATCGQNHNVVAIDDSTVVREFSYNYYIPNGKCVHTEDERFCVLASWAEFSASPQAYIEAAFTKRSQPIAQKVRVYPN